MRRKNFKSLRKFEKLEDRRMMVGNIDFDEEDGVLTITGGNSANSYDAAEVRFEGDEVVVDLYAGEGDDEYDYHNRDVDISEVNKIVFNGLSGPDILNVVVSNEGVDETLDHIVLEFHGGDGEDKLWSDSGDYFTLVPVRVLAWGDAGNDTLYGSSLYDDELEGGTGDDDLIAGFGNDKYVFSGTMLGSDYIYELPISGIDDTDTLDFSGLDHGIVIDLNSQYVVDSADMQLELEYPAIENVRGSSFNDAIIGNSMPNVLTGGYGDDNITGGEGNDTLNGGLGNDTYHFAGSNLGTDSIHEKAHMDNDTLRFSGMLMGLTIDLTKFGTSCAVESPDLRLTLSNEAAIEDVYGTSYRDTIIGNSRDNDLYGGRGNDTISGGLGADNLSGGYGDDEFWTDALDKVYGEAGTDTFDEYCEADRLINPRRMRYMDWGVF